MDERAAYKATLEALRLADWVHPELHPDKSIKGARDKAALPRVAHRLAARGWDKDFWSGAVGENAMEFLQTYLDQWYVDLQSRTGRDRANSPELEEIKQDLYVLCSVFRAAHFAGLPTDVAPPIPVWRLRKTNRLFPDFQLLAERYIRIRSAHLLALRRTGSLSAEERAGQLIVAAVLESGVVNTSLLRAVALAFTRPILATGFFHYVQIFIGSSREARKQARIIYLGPLTTTLLLRSGSAHYALITEAAKKSPDRLPTRTDLQEWGSKYLASLDLADEDRPTITELCRTASGYLQSCLPEFLWAYAAGILKSSSLPENVLRRMLGYQPRLAEASSVSLETIDDDDAVDAHAPLLGDADESMVTHVLDIFEKDLVAGTFGTRVSSSRAQTLRKLIEPTVSKVTAGQNLMSASSAQILSLIDEMRVCLGARSDRSKIFKILDRFAKTLAEISDISDPEEIGPGIALPSAGMVAWSEVQAACCRIDSMLSPTINLELRRIGKIYLRLLALGFRSGEAEVSRFLNVDPMLEGSIRVEPAPGGTLKSNSAHRLVPLGSCPKDLATQIIAEALAVKELQHQRGETSFLLARQDRPGQAVPVSRSQLYKIAVEVLRDVSGDPDIHPHTLRHSYASYLLLALMTDRLKLRELWPHLGKLGESIDIAEDIVKSVFGERVDHRNALWAVAIIVGHATPETTSEHYIHVLDLLLHAGLRTCAHVDELTLLKCASGLSRSTVRTSRVRNFEELIVVLESHNKGRVQRNDTLLEQSTSTADTAVADRLMAKWRVLRDVCEGQLSTAQGDETLNASPGTVASMLARCRKLHEVRTRKRGSSLRVHKMIKGRTDDLYPKGIKDVEASHAAARAVSVLERIRGMDQCSFQWLLDHFADRLMDKGRISCANLNELRRIQKILRKAKVPEDEIRPGKGIKFLRHITRPSSESGNYWISAAVSLKVRGGAQRSPAGAVWAWQMAYVTDIASSPTRML